MNLMEITMAILKQLQGKSKVGLSDLRDYPLNGIHHHHMVLATFCKGVGIDEHKAQELIHQKFHGQTPRRPLKSNEIEDAVRKAYRSPSKLSFKKMSGDVIIEKVFTKTSDNSFWNNEMPMPKVEANHASISKAETKTPWTLEDMFEESPCRVSDCTPAQIIQMLFDPEDLICCGSVTSFASIQARDWLSKSFVGEQIVPNPSRVPVGVNKSGKPSAHCRDATGERRYLVIESDDEDKTFDQKACVLRFLRDEVEARLAMVVHTAGKSLHGWYHSSGCPKTDWDFMNLACRLGADPRMWLPEQLARTPNALRDGKGLIQKCLYLDPR